MEFLVNYTYGKSLTNNIGYYGVDGNSDDDSYWQDVNNPRGNYGPSSFDARRSASGTVIYQLPFGHGKRFGSRWNGITDEVFGGWQVSMNAQLNSGFPLTVHQSGQQCKNNCAENFSGDYFGFANHYGPMKITGRGRNAAGVFKWFGDDPSATPCTSRGTAPARHRHGTDK